MIKRILILLTILVAQAIPAVAQSREKDLDRWLDRDLIPYVRQQLLVHPRFKNETVMFVVLRDNTPASVSNALAILLSLGLLIPWAQIRLARYRLSRMGIVAAGSLDAFAAAQGDDVSSLGDAFGEMLDIDIGL